MQFQDKKNSQEFDNLQIFYLEYEKEMNIKVYLNFFKTLCRLPLEDYSEYDFSQYDQIYPPGDN